MPCCLRETWCLRALADGSIISELISELERGLEPMTTEPQRYISPPISRVLAIANILIQENTFENVVCNM